MPARPLLCWGFQGTIDYRVQLSPEQFTELGVPLPEEDREEFITAERLHHILGVLRAQGGEVRWNTGGSPLISALTADHWAHETHSPVRSRFIGNVPDALFDDLSDAALRVVTYGRRTSAVAGTLSLEHLAASKKVMLAVPDGRWFDEDLAAAGLEGLTQALRTEGCDSFALGIGGLNKATLPLVARFIDQARTLPGCCLVYLAGGSFNAAVLEAHGGHFWHDLYQVLQRAEVISLNREEHAQLTQQYGEGWRDRLFHEGRARLIVRHSRAEAAVWCSPDLPGSAHTAAMAMMGEAAHAAASHAGRMATGLGARFDGVMSLQLLQAWQAFAPAHAVAH